MHTVKYRLAATLHLTFLSSRLASAYIAKDASPMPVSNCGSANELLAKDLRSSRTVRSTALRMYSNLTCRKQTLLSRFRIVGMNVMTR